MTDVNYVLANERFPVIRLIKCMFKQDLRDR